MPRRILTGQEAIKGSQEWKDHISEGIKSSQKYREALGLRQPKKRKDSTCHPGIPAKAFGLCPICYRHEYYLRHQKEEGRRSRAWALANPVRAAEKKRAWKEDVKKWEALDKIEYGA